LYPVNPVHRDDLHTLPPGRGTSGEPLFHGLFRPAGDHVQQPGRSGAVADRGEVDDHGDVLVAEAGVSPHVLVEPHGGDAVEPVRIVDQHPLALGEHGVVGGVPRHRQRLGDPGHGQMSDHDGLQRPPQAPAGQFRPRLGGLGGVLAPHVPAAAAAVAADRDQQRRGTPPERFVRERPGHGVPRRALAAAATTPFIGFNDPTRQDRVAGLEPLPGHLQPELVESAEGR
jgi:hypothetical protein